MVQIKKFWKTIAEDIKEDIISGKYRPLDRMKEADLAKVYHVSKTPIREAVRYLEGIGFLEIIPHTEVRVTALSRRGAKELYRITALLEGMVVQEAMPNLKKADYDKLNNYASLLEKCYRDKDYKGYEKANINFHSIIWKASNNEKFMELNNNIREQLQRFRLVTRRNPEKFKDIVLEHRKIIELVKNKENEKAAEFVTNHFKKNGEIIVNLLDNYHAFY